MLELKALSLLKVMLNIHHRPDIYTVCAIIYRSYPRQAQVMVLRTCRGMYMQFEHWRTKIAVTLKKVID